MDMHKPTVIYAPSWENDGKQDDYVQAMLKLDVNILIKQTPTALAFPKIMENVRQMKELHKKIDRVHLLDIESNIFEAIAISDILVSEESSTMLEAVLMDVPAVTVTNWLIPDTVPSRYPKDTYEFAIKTTKENLAECVNEIIANYSQYKCQTEEYRKNNFGEGGGCAKRIMDLLDAILYGEKNEYMELESRPYKRMQFKKWIIFWLQYFKRFLTSNLCQKSKLLGAMLKGYKHIKYGKSNVFS